MSDKKKARRNIYTHEIDLRKWVGKKVVLPSNVINLLLVGKNLGHPAVFPVGLPGFFVKLLSPVYGIVLDPFGGSGQTGVAALELERNVILVDNKKDYVEKMVKRIRETAKDISAKIAVNNFDTFSHQINVATYTG